jgi:hypothetical protein
MTALASRRLVCRLLIGVLLSTQLAIAAYACSGMSRMLIPEQDQPANAAIAMAGLDLASPIASNPGAGAAANQGNGMDAGCGRLDPAFPNLCVAHYQYGQQSADHSAAPTVPAALLTSLYTLPPLGESSERTGLASGPNSARAAADPPHATLHCCLRI